MATVTHQQAFDIALAHQCAGRNAEAEAIYRQLLAVYPGNPDLLHLLGVIADHSGRPDEALGLLQRAIAANPNAFAYHNNLGLLLTRLGRREDAVAAFQTAIRMQPDSAETHYNLGITLGEMGRAAESLTAYTAALRLNPAHPSALLNIGLALAATGRMDDAIAHYRTVLAQNPDNVSIAVNLGNLLKDSARLDEAVEVYRSALRIAPDDFNVLNNLGVALKDVGEIAEAIECIRRSMSAGRNLAEIHSNLIFTSYFHPALPQSEIAGELRRWNASLAMPLQSEWRPHPNDRSPDRRLRIGFVSPDLRDHVVGRTFLPCFEAHDREKFELFCYSEASVTDGITARFRELSAGWRDTALVSDADLANRIREDRIDILVDLALHTAFNRLLTFARKPAPVQIAWLGYPGTSGLAAMDFRITDRFLDPPGEDFAGGFEEPLRLPDAWCCYRPPEDSPDVSPLPAASSGNITFGSFNNVSKLNACVLDLWVRILSAVAGSRLLLVAKGSRLEWVRRHFSAHGISDDRVELLTYYPAPAAAGSAPPPPAYLLRYHRVDIALDPFPYNGMTTTCDALWMGVPVVALIGGTTLGRASFSLLSNVGVPEFAAKTGDDYVRIATELAQDIPRLRELRATLRGRMKTSPLLDAPRFARNIESAYRTAWQRWCSARTGADAAQAGIIPHGPA